MKLGILSSLTPANRTVMTQVAEGGLAFLRGIGRLFFRFTETL